ncbi:MAG: sigma-70 family RNA polymerase sigma factor [Actinomycetota bacterium]|nr:sigma-70 family RNA polymerase sigma factor [Actinomycetota bacterium]
MADRGGSRMRRHETGLAALRRALVVALLDSGITAQPELAAGPVASASYAGPRHSGWLFSQVVDTSSPSPAASGGDRAPDSDHDLAASSAADAADQQRLIALVELARGGDKEAFGLLYDHYQTSVYRFIYYRVGAVQLAEDLTGETFFRALRSMNGFRWQGRDFGAWLMTIARNLTSDHFKSGRTRLEQTTEDMGTLDSPTDGPETSVLAALTNEALLEAIRQLPQDQQDCLVLRFLQGKSLAETAGVLERSAGAIKQLQLRAVRNLAALLPEGLR